MRDSQTQAGTACQGDARVADHWLRLRDLCEPLGSTLRQAWTSCPGHARGANCRQNGGKRCGGLVGTREVRTAVRARQARAADLGSSEVRMPACRSSLLLVCNPSVIVLAFVLKYLPVI